MTIQYNMDIDAFDYTPADNAFARINKVRKMWVSMVKGTQIEFKLSMIDNAADRHMVYNEIDREILVYWAKLLREYNEYHHSKGHTSNRTVIGRRILQKEFLRDPDESLYDACVLALDELAKDFRIEA